MNNVYDIGIIGAGVAGAFASYKLSQEYNNLKVVLFDLGRPPLKRRRQLEGWLGALPNSDGKLYQSNIDAVSKLIGKKKSKSNALKINTILSNISDLNLHKDSKLSKSLENKLRKYNYNYFLNDYIQLIPKQIHDLSRFMSGKISDAKNITYRFDDEVFDIFKKKGYFLIKTEFHEIKCKKILISVGRSGWRWVHNLYKKFDIIENNDYAKFGIRIEMQSDSLKDFKESCCTLYKENLEIGPLSWNGTVIPEDHLDLAISSFRSNEDRWKTDKVSFNLIGNIEKKNNGVEQTDRLGKLSFILSNDRIAKEKLSLLLNNKSKISIIPEYNWLKKEIIELSNIIPDLIGKSYFYFPTISALPSSINIGNNLETDISGMFVAGESAGISGLLSAAIMGNHVVDGLVK